MALFATTIVTVALPTIRTGLYVSPAIWSGSSPLTRSPTASPYPGRPAGDRSSQPLFLRPDHLHAGQRGRGLSQNEGEIVAARAIQGIGPGSSTGDRRTIQLSFTGSQRSKAFSALAPPSACRSRPAAARRPDHRGRGCRRRLALGVLVDLFIGGSRCRCRPQLPGVRSAFAAIRPGRAVAAVRRALLLLIPLVEGEQVDWPAGCTRLSAAVWSRSRCSHGGRRAPSGAARARCSSEACWLAVVLCGGDLRRRLFRWVHQRVLHHLDPVAGRAEPAMP